MDNRDISNIGEQIRDSVQDAIDSMDFKQLNRTISDTVNSALDEARKQLAKGLGQSQSQGQAGEVYRTNYGEGGEADRTYGENRGTAGGKKDGSAAGSQSYSRYESQSYEHYENYSQTFNANKNYSGENAFGSNGSQGSASGGSGNGGRSQAYGGNGSGAAKGQAFKKNGTGRRNEPGGPSESYGRDRYRRSRRTTEEPGYRAFQTSRQNEDDQRTSVMKEPQVASARFTPNGRVAGILFTVFGGIGLGLTGVLFLVVGLLALVAKPFWGAVLGSSVLVMLMGGVFGTMLGTGVSIRGRLRRAKRYLELAGKRLYCDIEELARNVGKSKKYVIKDIQRLIEKGILPEAHLDEKKTCLILNDETYQQYLSSQKSLKVRQEEEKLLEQEKKKTDAANREAAGNTAGSPRGKEGNQENRTEGLEQMMAQGRNYTRILREANEAIPGEVISAKIARLETVIRKIFESVERHPEQMEEMEKFMDYYLPTTVKLVNAYRDFDQVEIEGENIVSAKHEIEETLDTINRAFERLLDDLYQDAVMDITTDASVLQTMLEKDGFAGSDFAK